MMSSPLKTLYQPRLRTNAALVREDVQDTSTTSKILLDSSCSVISDHCLAILKESNEFLVIGVLGTEGSGKSTFMSSFHDDSEFQTIQPTQNGIDSYQTKGIHISITSDRVILLDCQPICSASIFQKGSKGKKSKPVFESDIVKQDLQIGLFLLSVCHVVIIMDDDMGNIELWKYMKTLEMLKWNIPDISTPTIPPTISISPKDFSASSNEYLSEIVMVYNQADNNFLSTQEAEKMQISLDGFFSGSKFKKCQINQTPSLVGSTCMNLFTLPRRSNHVEYESRMKSVMHQILALDKIPFAKPITELEWGKNCSLIWQKIQQSSLLDQYCDTTQ